MIYLNYFSCSFYILILCTFIKCLYRKLHLMKMSLLMRMLNSTLPAYIVYIVFVRCWGYKFQVSLLNFELFARNKINYWPKIFLSICCQELSKPVKLYLLIYLQIYLSNSSRIYK